MTRKRISIVPLVAVVLLAVGVLHAENGVPTGEWRHYGADQASSRYSPLDQIDRDNVTKLVEVWRWSAPDDEIYAKEPKFRPGVFKPTPLMVGGRLILPTSLGVVAALDPATGKTLWTYDPGTYKEGRPANAGWQHRGVEYWTDGKVERILYARHDRKLVSLDPATGIARPEVRRRRPRLHRPRHAARPRDQHPPVHPQLTADRLRRRRGGGLDHLRRTHGARDAARPRARLRRAHRRDEVDLPHHPARGRARRRDLGGRLVEVHRQHQRLDHDEPATRSSATSTCRPRRRPTTGTAATARATTCSPSRSSRSTRGPASVSGTSRRCTTGCGTTTSRARPISSTSPSTASRARSSRRSRSRVSPTCSIG